jgi:murein DD-endopeptidase MepM/ murein hydrolase activator NlpD
MEEKRVSSEGRGLRRTLIAVLGAITLATAVGSCGENPSGPLIGQSSSAVTGQWLYLPLSKIGSDVNGYYGWNIASQVCGTHFAEDLTGTQGDPVLAAADGNVLYAGPANDGTGLYFVTLTHSNGYTTSITICKT